MHGIPWGPVTFSRFTCSHRPWNIAGIVSLICANPIPRGLTSSALLLLEVIPPPSPLPQEILLLCWAVSTP